MDNNKKSLFAIIIPAIIVCVLIIYYTFFNSQSVEIINYTNDSEENLVLHETVFNINTVSFDELLEIDGIGEVTAQKIIDYRVENNGFDELEQLKNVDGIGDKTFEMLSKYFYVE